MSMSKQIDNGGPAFPCTIDDNGAWYNREANGMTLRDWFAVKCDIAIYNPSRMFFDQFGRHATPAEFAEYISTIRYLEADAMIAARKGDKHD
jgi:hypothetical protein